MECSIKQRVKELFAMEGINPNNAAALLGIPQRTLNRQVNENGTVTLNLVSALLRFFPRISARWLLFGEQEMYLTDNSCNQEKIENCWEAPYYNDLPVSAGRVDALNDINESPSGYFNIPGIKVDYYFPVRGCSMEPLIHQGDIIGVVHLDTCNSIDPAKIYMIVTRDERMIKRLRIDADDDTILWCESDNYPSFSVRKEDILHIHSVVFTGSKI